MSNLRKKFLFDASSKEGTVLVIAVLLPNGSIETITNYQNVKSKVNDLVERYDEEFRLKTNPVIRIVGYMLV